MGLFVLSRGKEPLEELQAALGNLDYFVDRLKGYEGIRDKYGNQMPDYLVGMAQKQIQDAIDLIKSAK